MNSDRIKKDWTDEKDIFIQKCYCVIKWVKIWELQHTALITQHLYTQVTPPPTHEAMLLKCKKFSDITQHGTSNLSTSMQAMFCWFRF